MHVFMFVVVWFGACDYCEEKFAERVDTFLICYAFEFSESAEFAENDF